jgi:transposase
MWMRDELGLVLEQAEFGKQSARVGQPGLSAWRLTLITIRQFAEGPTDRQAAEAVRFRIDWKYALGLSLTDEGFDASALREFRERLVETEAADYFLNLLGGKTLSALSSSSQAAWQAISQMNGLGTKNGAFGIRRGGNCPFT